VIAVPSHLKPRLISKKDRRAAIAQYAPRHDSGSWQIDKWQGGLDQVAFDHLAARVRGLSCCWF
jgi:hypothetical protein